MGRRCIDDAQCQFADLVTQASVLLVHPMRVNLVCVLWEIRR